MENSLLYYIRRSGSSREARLSKKVKIRNFFLWYSFSHNIKRSVRICIWNWWITTKYILDMLHDLTSSKLFYQSFKPSDLSNRLKNLSITITFNVLEIFLIFTFIKLEFTSNPTTLSHRWAKKETLYLSERVSLLLK